MKQFDSNLSTEVLDEITNSTAERYIDRLSVITFREGVVFSDGERVDHQRYIGKARNIRCKSDRLLGEFDGDKKSYQVIIRNPAVAENFNGITVKYRVSGWDGIRYVAIGHTVNKSFRHIKIANPKQGEWVIFSFGYGDIAYLMMNSWVRESPMPIGDFRVYVSGLPSKTGARIEVSWAAAWHDSGLQNDPDVNFSCTELLEKLKAYFVSCNPSICQQAERFLASGDCPMTGEVVLPWEPLSPTPDGMFESATYRYLWHAMHPAITLLVYGDNNNDPSSIHAARDFVNSWIESSYLSVDPDSKYTWYDHGTAERLLAFLMLYEIGRKYKFDRRFMARLSSVILQHGQLLESEAFYAFHQPTRYHNHAWFQDLALIAVALGMPHFPCSKRWLRRAIDRLEDQFRNLIIIDPPYSIFAENSIGYHLGVERLTKFSSELVSMTGISSDIPEVAEGLTRWSQFFVYPDGRRPSQGDTFRKPNTVRLPKNHKGKASCPDISLTALTNAGYAVVKGSHDGRHFMLCMFATSHSRTHKHEDNLSFTLFFDGVEWLIDPSMYSHDYKDTIPSYLRSAVAHNAVAIPELNYRIEPGLSKLDGEVIDDGFLLRGQHTAYESFLVSRKIHGTFDKLILKVTEQVEATLESDAQIYLVFHLGEGVHVSQAGSEVVLMHDSSEYALKLSGIRSAMVREGISHDDGLISITGHGFMEYGDTISLYVPMQSNSSTSWCLEAVRNK